MNTLTELQRYLEAELETIEYWRDENGVKSLVDFESELEPREFSSLDEPPQTPNKENAARDFWDHLYAELLPARPLNPALLVTTGIATVIVFIAVGMLAYQSLGPVSGVLFTAIATLVVAAAGLGLTWYTRHAEVVDSVNEQFDVRFGTQWDGVIEQHKHHLASHEQDQLQQRATWDECEQERIDALKALISGDPVAVKTRISEGLGSHSYASVDTVVVGESALISMTLCIPTLKDVINAKTRDISEKTGKLISKTKPKEVRIAEYKMFVAGTMLDVIANIFHTIPYCSRLEIALYSQGRTTKVFHSCGEARRNQLPEFSWDTVDPIEFLEQFDFRIEGSETKNLTSTPEWLNRLKSVRIGMAPKSKRRGAIDIEIQ